MKLIRFGDRGSERPGILLDGDTRVDVSSFGADYDENFFSGDGLRSLNLWLHTNLESAPRVPHHLRWGSPICRPSKIVCIGLNFRDHARETQAPTPAEPVIFFKSTSSMTGPNDDVVIPKHAQKVDWEVELAVVIGKKAAYVAKENAFDFVAGYVLHNDYSERSFQLERGGQWVKGKSADTFAPIGPFLATTDEIPNPQQLDMWLTVNGECRQKSTTAEMMFDVATLLSYISQFMTLLPGDVISTGTPAGVGLGMRPPQYLKPGDTVELGIAGLGQARQRIVPWNG
ncbi:MAG: fumarylacetoacetate hydrolase family protein [Acidobacteria bacterium]|nr:fumarylacetoacetate hydrolase family protein [Acidobacteriota bacterium]MBV8893347.1 fumarylacetoacetate hydrolase family protein [Acidobacteriota bacterium]MBV9483823.1 fumarylacetoacetate hydrolase family protein [Acidobacteriota bacterium]